MAAARIVGDYRRVPLYGTDFLIESKKADLKLLDGPMTDERIRLREDVSEQIRCLKEDGGHGCEVRLRYHKACGKCP